MTDETQDQSTKRPDEIGVIAGSNGFVVYPIGLGGHYGKTDLRFLVARSPSELAKLIMEWAEREDRSLDAVFGQGPEADLSSN